MVSDSWLGRVPYRRCGPSGSVRSRGTCFREASFWILLPALTVEVWIQLGPGSCALFVEEGDLLGLALVPNLPRPGFVHRTIPGTGFAAHNRPADSRQVQVSQVFEQRLET